MSKKSRKVVFVTPTKSQMKNVSVTPSKKPGPLYVSSLKTRGLQKLLDYVKKMETENMKLRLRENKLKEKLERCRDRKKRDKERFDEAITGMATRIFTDQNKHEKVSSCPVFLKFENLLSFIISAINNFNIKNNLDN